MKNLNSDIQKESKRIGLQTFFLNIENNHYDYVANKLIKSLEKKLKKLQSQISTDIKGPSYMKYMEVYFLEKELFAISEMKIIYAYKHFEIHLKFLLKASYQNIKETKFYKWYLVEEFLNSKKIKIKKITNYKEIEELRNLNNAIKHSRNILDNKTKNISEFQNKEELKYTDLNLFYKRIEESSLNFLKSLSKKIEIDLYELDNERIVKIAKKLTDRMDKEVINKLIEKMKN